MRTCLQEVTSKNLTVREVQGAHCSETHHVTSHYKNVFMKLAKRRNPFHTTVICDCKRHVHLRRTWLQEVTSKNSTAHEVRIHIVQKHIT